MSIVSLCLYPFANDNSLFAIDMDFAQRYLKMRRIVYVCLYIHISINIYTIFRKNYGRGILSIELYKESFVKLIFK